MKRGATAVAKNLRYQSGLGAPILDPESISHGSKRQGTVLSVLMRVRRSRGTESPPAARLRSATRCARSSEIGPLIPLPERVPPYGFQTVSFPQHEYHRACSACARASGGQGGDLRLDRLGRLNDLLRRGRNLSSQRRKNHLQVRRRRLVRVDATVSTVGATTAKKERKK